MKQSFTWVEPGTRKEERQTRLMEPYVQRAMPKARKKCASSSRETHPPDRTLRGPGLLGPSGGHGVEQVCLESSMFEAFSGAVISGLSVDQGQRRESESPGWLKCVI